MPGKKTYSTKKKTILPESILLGMNCNFKVLANAFPGFKVGNSKFCH